MSNPNSLSLVYFKIINSKILKKLYLKFYTKNGLKPDIIINPHAIPSRMTIAQLKRNIARKILLQLGLFGDGTSFGDLDINDISKVLKLGYEQHGNKVMYNGLTEGNFAKYLFSQCYQRLKPIWLMIKHSGSIGPKVNFTRQPAEEEVVAGGLRFGEIEEGL